MTGPNVPRSLRVFVNAVGVNVPAGSTVLEAVRAFDAAAADAVRDGDRIVTDSRGLPIAPTLEVNAGSIFRLVPRRRATDAPGGGDVADQDIE